MGASSSTGGGGDGPRRVPATAGEPLPSLCVPLGNPANRFLHIPFHLLPARRWGLTAREPGAVATLDVDTALGGLSLEAVQVRDWMPRHSAAWHVPLSSYLLPGRHSCMRRVQQQLTAPLHHHYNQSTNQINQSTGPPSNPMRRCTCCTCAAGRAWARRAWLASPAAPARKQCWMRTGTGRLR